MKRLPKPIQPLRGRAGIEPRSSVPCLQASTGTPEGGGNEPWGARGDTGGRSHPYCEEQAGSLGPQSAELRPKWDTAIN